ncbi:hypothetical protein [Marinobacter sp.]|uniref:hypothetical protein n=1 Tax=Marinobacter sp. TaxID=50741 RepID=UPI002B26657E|nr:hypothetical protein [Marinobacter sp.]
MGVTEWFGANAQWISAATSIGTMMIWIFYAQLLYSSYARQTRARVLINRAVGDEGLDSPCLVCNMSSEAVYVYFVMVHVETTDGEFFVPATDCGQVSAERNQADLKARTHQGPLESGSCRELFSFKATLERAAQLAGAPIKDGRPTDPNVELKAMEYHVICIYGSDKRPFGAIRRFEIAKDAAGHDSLVATTTDTQKRSSLRYQKQISRWLQEHG